MKKKGDLPALNDGQNSSTFLTCIKINNKPCDSSKPRNLKATGLSNFSFRFMNVKSEQEVLNKYDNDPVGEDLTEGKAQVLVEYGWSPNSGLGTMLNYCDKVMHDGKNEKDSSEWRSKIGKLLMDGYNGGTIVAPCISKRASQYSCAQTSKSCHQNI